jgi:hypothetical protein
MCFDEISEAKKVKQTSTKYDIYQSAKIHIGND